MTLPYGLRAVRGYERVKIERGKRPEEESCKSLKNRDVSVEMKVFPLKKDMEIPKNQYTKWFDYDRIKDTLSVRTRETGDYFMIGGERR